MTPREVFSLKSDAILHEGEKIPYMLIGIIAAGGGKGGGHATLHPQNSTKVGCSTQRVKYESLQNMYPSEKKGV